MNERTYEHIKSEVCVRILKVVIDREVNWAPHIDKLKPTNSRIVFLLRKIVDCIQLNFILDAYYAFFNPYYIIFWVNSCEIEEIVLKQKMAEL